MSRRKWLAILVTIAVAVLGTVALAPRALDVDKLMSFLRTGRPPHHPTEWDGLTDTLRRLHHTMGELRIVNGRYPSEAEFKTVARLDEFAKTHGLRLGYTPDQSDYEITLLPYETTLLPSGTYPPSPDAGYRLTRAGLYTWDTTKGRASATRPANPGDWQLVLPLTEP